MLWLFVKASFCYFRLRQFFLYLLWFCKLFAFREKRGLLWFCKLFAFRRDGYDLLDGRTTVFFSLIYFANFLRSGRKLGLFCFTKLAGVSILAYVFSSRDLLIHILLRFLATILLWHIGSCFVLLKWHRMRLYEQCAKCKRHLWTGCTSSCHPELDSGSINAKKFQNFFIVFAKKCIFFTIIKLYNLFFRRKTYARFRKQNTP